MASFSTVQTGDSIVSSNVNQFAEALSGQANIPISITGVSDNSNYAIDVKNTGTNARAFRVQDSSAGSRLQIGNTSTTYVQADPDGSGLSVVATLGHPQTLSSKTLSSATLAGVTLLSSGSTAAFSGVEANTPFIRVQGISLSSGASTRFGFSSAPIATSIVLTGGSQNAIVLTAGGSHATAIISDPGGVWSTVSGSTNKHNIYWSGGNGQYEIQAPQSGAITYSIFHIATA